MENKEAINNIYIGSHVSLNAPDYLLSATKEALSFGANTFMFYTGAPQNTIRIPVSRFKIKETKELFEKHSINSDKIVVHAPYIINLANTVDSSKFDFAVSFLKQEIKRVSELGFKLLVLHPGSHLGLGSEIGCKRVVEGLDLVLEDDDSDVLICLETMAGKGGEVGRTFEELAYIISHVKKSEKICVCLDTCHINDAGYNVDDIDTILNDFDRIIGLEKLKVLHINDSQNPIGAHKDRHANIGKGTIGLKTLQKYIFHPKLKEVPKILETPYIDSKPPYKEEIELLLKS